MQTKGFITPQQRQQMARITPIYNTQKPARNTVSQGRTFGGRRL